MSMYKKKKREGEGERGRKIGRKKGLGVALFESTPFP